MRLVTLQCLLLSVLNKRRYLFFGSYHPDQGGKIECNFTHAKKDITQIVCNEISGLYSNKYQGQNDSLRKIFA